MYQNRSVKSVSMLPEASLTCSLRFSINRQKKSLSLWSSSTFASSHFVLNCPSTRPWTAWFSLRPAKPTKSFSSFNLQSNWSTLLAYSVYLFRIQAVLSWNTCINCYAMFLIIKMQISLITMLAILTSCRHLSQHLYWFDGDQPTDFKDNWKWNYCDVKCFQLQQLSPGMDFIVINFHETLKNPFSACYVKNKERYFLWNKVIKNKFFEKVCGQDYKDWYAEGVTVSSIRGIGIGNER